MTAETLPVINACLNGLATVLLCSAYIAIKQNKVRVHATLMITAFVTSAIFLACYLTHKFLYPNRSLGIEPGLWKNLYFLVILVPHVVLAIVMLPLIAMTLWRAYHRDWTRHKKIARPTFWIWLYVSVTGVLIYFLLYHFFPQKGA